MPAGGGAFSDAPFGFPTGIGGIEYLSGVHGSWNTDIPSVRWGGPDLSLALGNLPLLQQGWSIPAVVPIPDPTTADNVPPEIDRRDTTPDSQELQPQMRAAIDWFEFHRTKLADGTPTLLPPGSTSTNRAITIDPLTLQTGDDMAGFDLGNLLGDLLGQAGSTWIDNQLGGGARLDTTPVGYNPALFGLETPDIGIPFVDVIPNNPGAACGGGSPVYKKVCGQYKWVTPKRRKRKRLLTKSDVKDLAALKGVLGASDAATSKAFQTWIATHS